MKILISVLLISSLSLLSETQCTNNNNLQGCNCQSLTCSCESGSCEFAGPNANPSCNCSLFSCSCGCSEAYAILPTANGTQNQNSEDSEEYFNGLGTTAGTTIAGYIKTLRTAIANEDLESYAENAPLLETAFKNLTGTEQNAYVTWALANLTPGND